MRHISFALTTQAFVEGKKTVTRRRGWKTLAAGEVLCAVEKGQGLKLGEKVKKLGTLKVLNVRREGLRDMIERPDYGKDECIKEGFPNMGPADFVEMYRKANHCPSNAEVTRIEFEKLP